MAPVPVVPAVAITATGIAPSRRSCWIRSARASGIISPRPRVGMATMPASGIPAMKAALATEKCAASDA